MKKILIAIVGSGLLAATAASAQTAPAASSPAAAAPYYTSEETTIGDLLDNPTTKAVLVKHIPSVVNNEGIDRARSMTLVSIQPYSNDAITDDTLKAIDADLAKVSAPKP